jgi:hypothetical protein
MNCVEVWWNTSSQAQDLRKRKRRRRERERERESVSGFQTSCLWELISVCSPVFP